MGVPGGGGVSTRPVLPKGPPGPPANLRPVELSPAVHAAAVRFRQRLEQALGQTLLEVRVFGSRARGEATPDSDLDVFVLVEGDEQALVRPVVAEASAVMLEQELPFAISPLVMSRDRFEGIRQRELRLARDLAREGVPV